MPAASIPEAQSPHFQKAAHFPNEKADRTGFMDLASQPGSASGDGKFDLLLAHYRLPRG